MRRRPASAAACSALRRRWPMLVGALSALALGLFLWQNDLAAMREALAAADLLVMLPALALFILHHVVRAARWQMLLAPLHDCGSWLPMRAMTIGVAINNVAPAKAGHVARAHMISAQTPLSRVAVGSSFLLEALLDGLLVLAFVALALLFVPLGPDVESSALAFALVMLVALGLTLLMATGRLPVRPFRALAQRTPAGVQTRVHDSARELRSGMGVLRGWRRVLAAVATSAAAYTMLAGAFLLLAASMRLDLSLGEAVAVVAVVNLATALPGAGGGLGTFEVMTAHVVGAMGVADASAAAYAVALHAMVVIPVTLLGITFVLAAGRARADLDGARVTRFDAARRRLRAVPRGRATLSRVPLRRAA